MRSDTRLGSVVPLFIPWLTALIFWSSPILSYWIAWAGSFFIFYWTWFSSAKFLSKDLPVSKQIMRPIFLIQLIFAGFMCSTSIFYMLDHLGYKYLERVSEGVFFNSEQTFLIAKCQRLALLGHIAIVVGIIVKTKAYPRIDYVFNSKYLKHNTLSGIGAIVYVLGLLVQQVPGMGQLAVNLINLAIFIGAYLFVQGLLNRKLKLLLFGGVIFISNFINSTLSGFKEHILINFIILGCLLYPHYKRAVTILGIPVIYILFYILPTYATVIRQQAWTGAATAEQARSEAFQTILTGSETQIEETNWAFLTDRFSEIGMFVQFVDAVPERIDYYGFDILIQSLESLIPRLLWPSKPDTEELSMERVYVTGVIDRSSPVSAKARPVVDGYLSGGAFGVFISLFLYGLAAQYICNKAESWFGGYELGTVIIFNSLFQSLWRGNNFEFLLNSVFWSFIIMVILFRVLKASGYLIKNYSDT